MHCMYTIPVSSMSLLIVSRTVSHAARKAATANLKTPQIPCTNSHKSIFNTPFIIYTSANSTSHSVIVVMSSTESMRSSKIHRDDKDEAIRCSNNEGREENSLYLFDACNLAISVQNTSLSTW